MYIYIYIWLYIDTCVFIYIYMVVQVGLGFEEEGEKINRIKSRIIADIDDGYDDTYNSDDDFRNRNYGNNDTNDTTENELKIVDKGCIDIAKIIDSDVLFSYSDDTGTFFENDSYRNRKNSNINDSIDDLLGSIG